MPERWKYASRTEARVGEGKGEWDDGGMYAEPFGSSFSVYPLTNPSAEVVSGEAVENNRIML
jgi:hypothetical protein